MRTTYCLLISLFISFSSFAQAELNFGITAALNYSTISWNDISNIDIKAGTGISFGVVAEMVLSDRIKFPVSLMYSLKGHSIEENGDFLTSYTYHYLDLMPEFDARIIGPIRAGMGLKVGYSVQEFQWIPGQSSQKVDLLDPLDVGLTGNVKVLFDRWELFCRYDLGIVGVNEIFFTDENGNTIGQTDQYNRNLQLGVSIIL